MALIDELAIEVGTEGEATTVTVSGEVDFGNVARLRAVFVDLVGEVGEVRLDLGDVGFMDSTSLGVIIQGKKKLEQAGRQLVVTAVSPRARRIIEIAGLTEYLGV